MNTRVTGGSKKIELLTSESLQYDLVTLKEATENFSESNKIGRGALGIVYKVSSWFNNEWSTPVTRLHCTFLSGRVSKWRRNCSKEVDNRLQHRRIQE
ncbi:hypothetical protein Droror1_Dr00020730 [Drosera rotundifolia]